MSEHKDQYQRPEGKLIEAAYLRMNLTATQAAAAGGLKPQRFGDIVKGYDFSNGEPRPVIAKAPRMAQIALGLGISADQLRAAKRDDAADQLLILEGMTAEAAAEDESAELHRLRNIQRDVEWLIDRLTQE